MNDRGTGRCSFVVRMWIETDGRPGGEEEWRGTVQRVGDGATVRFRQLDRLPAAVLSLLSGETEEEEER